MYFNLKSAMSAENITINDLAAVINTHRNSVRNKINGEAPWLYEEAEKIQNTFFRKYTLSWLFYKVVEEEVNV